MDHESEINIYTKKIAPIQINEPTLGSSGGGGCTVRSAGS